MGPARTQLGAWGLGLAVLGLGAGCSAAGPGVAAVLVETSSPPRLTLPGTLHAPADAGRHPAVVLLHGTGGLEHEPHVAAYQPRLARAGYVSLVVDSWRARGVPPPLFTPPGHPGVDRAFAERILDAWAAIRHLRARDEVDPDRVAVIGFSDGGRVALHVAAGLGHAGATVTDAALPRAAVGYYPSCSGPTRESTAALAGLRIPFLAHVAGKEDFERPRRCPPVFARLLASGASLTVHTYPEALHAFDAENYPAPFRGPEGTVGHDPAAARLAWDRTLAFLARHLTP